jgi:hypothetical protein
MSAMLYVLLRGIAAHLRLSTGAAHAAYAHLGAESLIHRFDASLNRHVSYAEYRSGPHVARAVLGTQVRSRRIGLRCVVDGAFQPVAEALGVSETVRFQPAAALTPAALAANIEPVRVLRWFARTGLIDPPCRRRDADLVEQRTFARCRGADCRSGSRGPGAAVSVSCPPALSARASQTGRRSACELPLVQGAMGRKHCAVPDAAGADRSSRGLDPAIAVAPPSLPRCARPQRVPARGCHHRRARHG